MNLKYKIIETIGEGTYGIVYKCKNTETNEIVAIKKFIEEYEQLPKLVLNREVFLLQTTHHENLVKLKESFINKGYLFLVFDYAEKNLLQLIEENQKGLSPELIRSFTYQICKAISYLHKKNIIHRDIKPENLLIIDNTKIELCDFGFARKMKINEKTHNYEKMTEYMATRWYRAPEILLSQGNYGPEVDFWSIGCLIGEMATGKPMFPGKSQLNQLECIIKLIGNLPDNLIKFYDNNPNYNINKLLIVDKPETLEKRYEKILDSDAIDFMKQLLELDPKKRLNADTVFNHKYFECYKNSKSIERNDNNLFFSLNNDNIKINKIPSIKLNNSNKKESKIINIIRYDDEPPKSETNENNLSKNKIEKPLIKSFQNKKRKHFRGDMIDFGDLYTLSEKNKIEEKNNSFDSNKSEDTDSINKNKIIQLKLDHNRLNHKKSFSMIKNNNISNTSNKNITEQNFPYLDQNYLMKNKSTERKNKKENKKINYYYLINNLKSDNIKNPFFNKILKTSKKINLASNDKKSYSKDNKKYNNSLEYKFKIYNNNYYKSEKRKSFDNLKNQIYDNNNCSSRRIINLYEDAFKDLVLKTNENEKISPRKKRKSVFDEICKKLEKKSFNNSPKKNKFQLPSILNFNNGMINIHNNEKNFCNNFFKND